MRLLAVLLLALAQPAAALTYLVPPVPQPGFCSVTSRPQLGIPDRSLVFCRWPGADVTGDGQAEIVELRLLLKRDGSPDCARSTWTVLDLTRERQQAVFVGRVCP
jgi:hypothetical protein